MFFGNARFWKRMSWRLLSPLAALVWVAALVGMAGAAHAVGANDPGVTAAAGSENPRADTASQSGASTSRSDTATASTSRAPAEDVGQRQDSAHAHGSAGDLTSPQPISNADANTGGANGQCPSGPYCSTRDGSPSANGSGDGKALGEPCAGCVGKADNKNPQGQMPNASDANAGYECDTNHGIAQTNPAHTGCTTAPPECVPTEENPCTPPECVPTEENPCVTPPECVPSDTVTCSTPPLVSPPSAGPPATAVSPPTVAQPAAPAAAQVLPNTGAPANLPWLAGAALASIVAGLALLTSRKRVAS